MTLYNFMCHPHVKVPLGARLNFIIGHNGSGKSAILTAITLCLGLKASATQRGRNLAALIRSGQEHCEITVRLRNRGPDAFRPLYLRRLH